MGTKGNQKGYPIPSEIEPEGTRCVAVRIPDDDDYHRAIIGQVTELSKWWSWKRTNPIDKDGKFTAERFRNDLLYTQVGDSIDCRILDTDEEVIITTMGEICEEVLCALEEMGARIALGVKGTIEYDEEGNPILTDGEGGSIGGGSGSIDSLLLKMAKAEYVEERIEEYIEDFETYYNGGNTELFMTSKYLLNANITQAVSDYADHRTATNPAPNPNLSGVDRVFFCNGANKSAVASWVIDDAQADKVLRLTMLDALTQEQYEAWENEKTTGVSDDYVNTACFINQPVTITIKAEDMIDNGAGSHYFVSAFLKQNRTYLVKISGNIVYPSGQTWDGMYRFYNNNATYDPMKMSTTNFSNRRTPLTQPTYSETGYSVVYKNGSSNGALFFETQGDPASYTGAITYTFIDNGAG